MKILGFAILVLALSIAGNAFAVDCPPGMKSCKVLYLSPDEEKALLGDKMILQTAAQARAIDLGGVVNYFVNKIAQAPAGDVKAPDKPADKAPPKDANGNGVTKKKP